MDPPIEPGILRTFRWFEWLRLAIVVLTLWPPRASVTIDARVFAFLSAVEVATLLVLLNWPGLPRRMTRWFLPVTLGIATIGPLVQVAAATALRVRAGTAGDRAIVHAVQVAFLLFVPLVLVAWQYRFRTVLLYSVGTVVVELLVTSWAVQRVGGAPNVGPALLLLQLMLFIFVGGVITRLAHDQRRAREELARHAIRQEDIATERERTRLARELHDTLAHGLAGVAIQLEAATANWDADRKIARTMVDRSLQATREGLAEVRRAISALRAGPLEELGLVGAIERRAEDLRSVHGLEVATSLGGLAEIDPEYEQPVYRFVDEALTNVARHSGAKTAVVQAVANGRTLRIQVGDDGRGFDPAAVDHRARHGLVGAAERAGMAGGSLTVDSAPGRGTTVTFELPR